MSEDQLQASIFQHFHNTYPEHRGLLFHPANGGLRNIREAAKLKAIGVVKGIPDLILIHPLTAFELKTSTGVLSPEQKKIHAKWKALGIEVHEIRTLEEFKKILTQLL